MQSLINKESPGWHDLHVRPSCPDKHISSHPGHGQLVRVYNIIPAIYNITNSRYCPQVTVLIDHTKRDHSNKMVIINQSYFTIGLEEFRSQEFCHQFGLVFIYSQIFFNCTTPHIYNHNNILVNVQNGLEIHKVGRIVKKMMGGFFFCS